MNGVSKDRDRGLNISTGEGNNKLQQKHLKSEFRAAGHYAVSIIEHVIGSFFILILRSF